MPSVKKVWQANAELVERLKLSPAPGGIIEQSWMIMVYCDVPDVDAHDLTNALRHLEHEVEKESGLDVTLMLSIVPEESVNGTE